MCSRGVVEFVTKSRGQTKSKYLAVRFGRVANPKGEDFLCGPKEGFWLDDFFKKESPLGSISFLNNVRRYRRSAAPERLMTDLA